jgi:ATP-dependent RNA/DNA helicase IGHMBP2
LKKNKIFSQRLNDSQNEALQKMNEAEDLVIIHGPPGTGKTTTLVEGIKHFASPEKPWLVCAPSNAAADHLTRSIAASGLNVVRIGNLAKIEEDTTAHTLDVLLQQEKDFKQIRELKKRATELRKMGGKYKRSFGREEAEQRKLIFREAKELNREARELENYLVQKVLDKAHAITCTLIGSTHEYLKDKIFDTVVVDEAGQAMEPACWVPILKARRVILAGDPFQLPPTVKSQEAARRGLSVTLLEKAIQRHEGVQLLRTQYRMHHSIMEFSNQQFYSFLPTNISALPSFRLIARR